MLSKSGRRYADYVRIRMRTVSVWTKIKTRFTKKRGRHYQQQKERYHQNRQTCHNKQYIMTCDILSAETKTQWKTIEKTAIILRTNLP